MYRTLLTPDWITVALFLSIVCLALAKYFFQNRFLSFILLPFTNKYVVLYNKKGQLASGFHVLLTLFQLINLSLFFFLAQKNLLGAPLGSTAWGFFILMGGLLLFQLGKLGLQCVNAFVFNTQELTAKLIFYKIAYLNYSSFALFFGNAIFVYLLKESTTTLYISLFLMIFLNVVGVIRLLKTYQNAVFPYFWYFILYLCTLDIAPLLLLVSYVKD